MPSRRRPRPTDANGATEAPAAAARAADDALVVARGLAKTYVTGEVETVALAGVDLEIGRGEMVAVMGPSGCGKTTLLNCLSGLEAPTGGTVSVDGQDLWALRDDARTRFRARAMGFVFQAYNLLPVLSAEENVELPLLVAGIRPREARRRAHEALALVGLDGREHHRPQQLSGGQQQRVAIARSLVHDPPLVWADEPTGNLDGETSAEVMSLVTELNRSTGKTFVIVTHDVGITERCHRTIHMASGRIVGADDDGTARAATPAEPAESARSAKSAKPARARGRAAGGRKR